eukprot:TRINITY_DN924_c0_g1_i6.p1 TRINITY_DN924_c0_g1~~TRINITY_DN924_c0_g1_i6.p1  ORF type:complete len:672 (+),score=132.04 TRINITY_DN924_c0_g1_i6:584-2599(+)
MKYIWKRLSQKDKQWRRILKTLNLVEYLLKNGSPRCLHEFKDEIYTLRSFQDYYLIEGEFDRGASIKERAKVVIDLLSDQQKLDREREQQRSLKGRLQSAGFSNYGAMSNSSSAGGASSKGGSSYQGFGSGGGTTPGNYGSSTGLGSYDTFPGGGAKQPNGKNQQEPVSQIRETNDEDYQVKTGTKYDISQINNASANDQGDEVVKPKDLKQTTNKPLKLPGLGQKKEHKPFNIGQGTQKQTTTATTAGSVSLIDDILDVNVPPTTTQQQTTTGTTSQKEPDFLEGDFFSQPPVQKAVANSITDLWGNAPQQPQQQNSFQQQQHHQQNTPNIGMMPFQQQQPQGNIGFPAQIGFGVPQHQQQPNFQQAGLHNQQQGQFGQFQNAYPQPIQQQQAQGMGAGFNSFNQFNQQKPQQFQQQQPQQQFTQQKPQQQQQQQQQPKVQQQQKNNAFDDDFNDFVSADQPQKPECKFLSDAEANLVSLDGLSLDQEKKSQAKSQQSADTGAKKTFDEGFGKNLLLTTKDDLDFFGVGGDLKGGLGQRGLGQGGLGQGGLGQGGLGQGGYPQSQQFGQFNQGGLLQQNRVPQQQQPQFQMGMGYQQNQQGGYPPQQQNMMNIGYQLGMNPGQQPHFGGMMPQGGGMQTGYQQGGGMYPQQGGNGNNTNYQNQGFNGLQF